MDSPPMADNLPAVPDDVDDVDAVVLRDIHYETDLDEAPQPGPPVPVDPAAPREQWLPVIPDAFRRDNIRGTLARAGGRHWHTARYHGFRAPAYLLAASLWAVVGVLRVLGRLIRWWHVTEQHGLRSDAAAAGDSREWLKLHKEAKETRRVRGIFLAGLAGGIIIATAAMVAYSPWWGWALLAALLLAFFARAGRPADRPIIGQAVVTPRYRRLSADIVLRAYYAAGLGHPDKPDQQVMFGGPMHRDGEGSAVLVDLPYGKTLRDAVEAKDRVASGIDVTESQIFIRRDPTSTRRHMLWVADRDPLAVPVGRTPLLACRATDIWKPAPLGLDERGQLVKVPVLWHSILVGALPRQGKTFSARLLALFAALDPYCQLDVFDASGKPDWRKFALVAESSAFGLTPTRDGKPPEILLHTLERIRADVEDRYERLSALPTHVCPEGKLTRAIARDPRYKMPVRVLVLDEMQEYFELGSISGAIAELLVYLVRVAPGAGVSLIDATQRPSGIGSGGEVAKRFTAFRDLHQLRFSLRTPDWRVSEMVLGAGSLGEGADSSKLLPEYKGVGILRGATDACPTVRCFLADHPDAEKILLAARALRERAGTLAGMAAGIEASALVRDVLADVLAVFGADTGLHWAALAERLAAQFPGRWAEAADAAVSAQCRELSVPSVDVRWPPGRDGAVRKGCRRSDVEAATRNTPGQGA
jgi:hypothetical protein